ncbi:hypothetical protein F5Y15DRAFT_377328 [Xylariaceae sp. FL0016]|nr:hypothetical protein F5Y15DRAFT_377328 [Xylariaceae sp. FL0016]
MLLFRVLTCWDPRLVALRRHMNKKQAEIWGFEWQDPDAREKALRFFDAYYADCRARIPEERRIEFKVQDGWEPLCRHLGVPIPTTRIEDGNCGSSAGEVERAVVPFPWTNDAAEFNARVAGLFSVVMRRGLWEWAERLVIVGTVGVFSYKYWPRGFLTTMR